MTPEHPVTLQPKMHSQASPLTNLYCISDHRGDTSDGLNIVEFSLDLRSLIARLSDSFYGSLLKQTGDTHGLLRYSYQTAMCSNPCLITSRGCIANLQCEREQFATHKGTNNHGWQLA